MTAWVCCKSSRGTFWNLAASGLNSGVSINCRNRFDSLSRKPSRLPSERPLLSMSASLSIKSTISLVKLQSNSTTVHFVCSSTSSRSSVVNIGRRKPLYRSINSLARVLNGVCTSVNLPSERFQSLGSDIALRKLVIFSVLFLEFAWIFNRSIYCNILVSLFKSCSMAKAFSWVSSSLLPLIFLVSLSLQASNSLYKISKSLPVFGCMRL